jgi:hypothetical protein
VLGELKVRKACCGRRVAPTYYEGYAAPPISLDSPRAGDVGALSGGG